MHNRLIMRECFLQKHSSVNGLDVFASDAIAFCVKKRDNRLTKEVFAGYIGKDFFTFAASDFNRFDSLTNPVACDIIKIKSYVNT